MLILRKKLFDDSLPNEIIQSTEFELGFGFNVNMKRTIVDGIDTIIIGPVCVLQVNNANIGHYCIAFYYTPPPIVDSVEIYNTIIESIRLFNIELAKFDFPTEVIVSFPNPKFDIMETRIAIELC